MCRAFASALTFLPYTVEIADRAATLRVTYGLRTPDAIHLATAIAVHADCYVINDRKLKAVKEIPVITLFDLIRDYL